MFDFKYSPTWPKFCHLNPLPDGSTGYKCFAVAVFRPMTTTRGCDIEKYIEGLARQIERFVKLYRRIDRSWIMRVYYDNSILAPDTRYSGGTSGERDYIDRLMDRLRQYSFIQMVRTESIYRERITGYSRGFVMTVARLYTFFDPDIEYVMYRDLHRTLTAADRDRVRQFTDSRDKQYLIYMVKSYRAKHIYDLVTDSGIDATVRDYIAENNSGMMAAMWTAKCPSRADHRHSERQDRRAGSLRPCHPFRARSLRGFQRIPSAQVQSG